MQGAACNISGASTDPPGCRQRGDTDICRQVAPGPAAPRLTLPGPGATAWDSPGTRQPWRAAARRSPKERAVGQRGHRCPESCYSRARCFKEPEFLLKIISVPRRELSPPGRDHPVPEPLEAAVTGTALEPHGAFEVSEHLPTGDPLLAPARGSGGRAGGSAGEGTDLSC